VLFLHLCKNKTPSPSPPPPPPPPPPQSHWKHQVDVGGFEARHLSGEKKFTIKEKL